MPRFPKTERLSSKKAIDNLFQNGDSGFVFPFRYYTASNEGHGARMLVSVGKRNHKRANSRNLIKRRVKESYRLSKESLGARNVDLGLIYVSKQSEEYKTINNAIQRVIKLICGKS